MTATKTGLTLGKFAPLHKGHQLVIETALAEMDEVLVLVYDAPELARCPLAVRAQWIRDLYPNADVLEGRHGPTQTGDTPEIKRIQEDYVLGLLNGRRITHFYSSEFYGEHMSRALQAENRLVDPDRRQVPVSATAIRADPYRHRHFMHPRVYRDLVTHVVFLGAPSTGKTTLAQRMAEEYGTVWMPEYGREYWDAHQVNRRLTLEQLVDIAEGHLQREEQLLHEANGYLFTDTNAVTTYLFSLYYHGRAAPRLVELANSAATRYDIAFLCDTDIPYDDTWDRSGDQNRQEFQDAIVADLRARGIPFVVLSGPLEGRIQQVKAALGSFRKHAPSQP
ncbi:MAG: AAA family ATPase [Kiritimatiellae bacterium]|nr:AAA family ATPase [Kiritimatiellia bacterium]